MATAGRRRAYCIPKMGTGIRATAPRVRVHDERSEIVGRVGVEDLGEHLRQSGEVAVGTRRVAGAVQLGDVGLVPVEAVAALGQQKVEEFAGGQLVALPDYLPLLILSFA
jgi:hypothetical protein